MTLRQTHTYAELELSPVAYEEIAAKLREAEYNHAFVPGSGTPPHIDMHGIGVSRGPVEPHADSVRRIFVASHAAEPKVTHLTRALEISRSTLYRKLKEYGLRPDNAAP